MTVIIDRKDELIDGQLVPVTKVHIQHKIIENGKEKVAIDTTMVEAVISDEACREIKDFISMLNKYDIVLEDTSRQRVIADILFNDLKRNRGVK